jgi:hypothetical protein
VLPGPDGLILRFAGVTQEIMHHYDFSILFRENGERTSYDDQIFVDYDRQLRMLVGFVGKYLTFTKLKKIERKD